MMVWSLSKPDILECEVKWALEIITRNKASGGDGIPVELFQILKDDAVKVLHSICQQIWKTQQWPQDWIRSVFIPIPNKGKAKEYLKYLTIAPISDASWKMLEDARRRCPLINDRNGMDLTEIVDIKKKWQEYTEELYKKRSSWPR